MTLPKENLDDKTFEALVKEAVSRIPVYAPEWTDHNVHDPGITFIELFAWLAEMQIYRLNRISDESYRKFLKLMGIPKLEPAKAAEVDVSFYLRNHQPIPVKAETQVAAIDPISGEDIIFETKEKLNVVDAELKTIFSRPYLFSWDNVPGSDSERLLRFLRNDLDISWAGNAEINKSDDGKTIRIFKDENSAEIVIDEDKEKATLKIRDGRAYDLKVKKENGTLRIYSWFIDNTKANENENVYYYAFRYKPEEGDELYLGFNKTLTGKEITPAFYLYEDDLATAGGYGEEKPEVYPSATLSWEYYTGGDWKDEDNWSNRLEIKDETRHLTVSGKIRIKIEEEMGQTVISNANLFWLRCRVDKAMFSISDGELEKDLNTDSIPERLKNMFKEKNIPLSENIVITKENDNKWMITDKEKRNTYIVRKEDGKLNIYTNLFWLPPRTDLYEIPPKIDVIRLNTVSAIQRVTFKDCKFSSSGLPDFYLDLNTPIIDKTVKVKVKDKGEEEKWSEVEDFDASKPGDMHYTVDLATGRVTFGDGIKGKIPPKAPKGEDNIIVSYRSGGGVRGKVEPKAINKVLGELAEQVAVENKKAAFGGEEAEMLEDAMQRARRDLKTVYRAVTSEDYKRLAKDTPGLRVARAKAIPRYHPSQGDSEVPGIVTVVVVPESPYVEPKPGAGFLKTVYSHLDKHRLLTTELFVISPEYIEVSVEATVVIKPKYVKNKVEERVREKLESFLHPIRRGADRKGWPFGRSVYISEIYEIIDRVEGVDYVKTVTLKKNGEKQEGDIKISAHDLVCSGTHEIIAIEFIFSIDEQLISELNNKIISKGLKEAFKTKKGITISEKPILEKVEDNKWKIIDGKEIYIITKENKKLNIYKGEIHG